MNETTKTCDLMIILTGELCRHAGRVKIVKDVSRYGLLECSNSNSQPVYVYNKDGRDTYIPCNSVLYFGIPDESFNKKKKSDDSEQVS